MVSKIQGRRTGFTGSSAIGALDAEIEDLIGQPVHALREIWRKRLGSEAPKLKSREVMGGLLAWKIQAGATGGLDASTARKLREIADALERDGTYEPKLTRRMSAGLVVTREWKGVIHKVSIVAGGFSYQSKQYKSLSVIARVITGTRWSGPRFFGLEQKRKPIAKSAAR
jgi:hypothetical protein